MTSFFIDLPKQKSRKNSRNTLYFLEDCFVKIIALTRFVPWWYAQTEVSHQFQMELAAEAWLIVPRATHLGVNGRNALKLVMMVQRLELPLDTVIALWKNLSCALQTVKALKPSYAIRM